MKATSIVETSPGIDIMRQHACFSVDILQGVDYLAISSVLYRSPSKEAVQTHDSAASTYPGHTRSRRLGYSKPGILASSRSSILLP